MYWHQILILLSHVCRNNSCCRTIWESRRTFKKEVEIWDQSLTKDRWELRFGIRVRRRTYPGYGSKKLNRSAILNIHQHVRPFYVHTDNSPTLLSRAMKPSTCRGCAEILGDPYSKKSPLPSIGTSSCLAASPKDISYRVLGQSRIHHRHTTNNNHTRILAQ